MKTSRRDFLKATLAGTGGLCLGGCVSDSHLTSQAFPTDEDGYRLWLRYAAPGKAVADYRTIKNMRVEGATPTCVAIRNELRLALTSLLGSEPATNAAEISAGMVIVGTPANSALIRDLPWRAELGPIGPEGFILRTDKLGDHAVTFIAANTDLGTLYGVFHWLRLLQTGQPIHRLNVVEQPALQVRLMNHWDNPDGTVERGYAGASLWRWPELPGKISPRYTDYARACASLGINGAVVNNVNAEAGMLWPNALSRAAVIANVWRPYGVRLFLSANFAAPMRTGELSTADPLAPAVAAWWRAKADEIYSFIPDFGGFLVKANSEGQPGPKTYGRTHAEGANVLADALSPHGGIVMWRAFVYDENVDPDRAKRAYLEFTRLDGQFRPNVAVQVKNGPIDFQPREPFHPLFGALKHTSVIAEIQATQEYLGQAKHLVYLGPQWQEFLEADTFTKGKGSTVARVLADKSQRITGLVSVTNPGLDRNWCGHHFSQANWYAFGRLAWNPQLSAAQIAAEWVRMTFTNEEPVAAKIQRIMLASHETFVNYTMPLGLHHLIGGDHYAPMPWNDRAPRADWTATYYHQAAAEGIGFDRTRRGNRAVEQYAPEVCAQFDDLARCPEKFLLWFHRCPWDYRVKSGRTLWDELCLKYHLGAQDAANMQRAWLALAGKIDARRHREVAERLTVQVSDAARWRDQILEYFARFSRRPIVRPNELKSL